MVKTLKIVAEGEVFGEGDHENVTVFLKALESLIPFNDTKGPGPEGYFLDIKDAVGALINNPLITSSENKDLALKILLVVGDKLVELNDTDPLDGFRESICHILEMVEALIPEGMPEADITEYMFNDIYERLNQLLKRFRQGDEIHDRIDRILNTMIYT